MTSTVEFPLPEPYSDNTPQDVADALRDHADLRMGMPVLDLAAMAGAALIEKQAAEIERLTTALDAVEYLTRDTDGGDIDGDADIPIGEIRRVLAEGAGR